MIPRRWILIGLAITIAFHVMMHVRAGCSGWELLTCDGHATRWAR